MIGVGASVSGAFLVVVSAVITILTKKEEKSKTATSEAYGNGGPNPEIVIDETLYSESFEDNLCQERHPDQMSDVHLPEGYLPNMEHLGKKLPSSNRTQKPFLKIKPLSISINTF